ncbi:MAG: Lrp/AsnC family transcriptional regulator [archaeon]
MRLNKKRLLLIRELRNDARKSLSDMSRDTGIPVTTIFDNYNKLVDGRIILRHSPMIDFKKLGFNFRSFLLLKAKDRDEIADFLDSQMNVNSVFRISGYDYLVDCVFPGIREFYDFTDALKSIGVSEVEVHDVIEQLKYEEFFS